MKQFVLKLTLIVALLLPVPTPEIYAYDFEVDGIKYETITSDRVRVVSATVDDEVIVDIPSYVECNGEKYQVTNISAKFRVLGSENGSSLTLQIPASVENIESDFDGDYHRGVLGYAWVAIFEVSPDNEYYASQDGVLFSKDFSTLYKYPRENINKSYSVPDGVQEIFDYAICRIHSLESVTISNSVIRINEDAFSGCNILREVNMSQSVQVIGTDAFESCPITSDIILPATLEYIGDDAFGCDDRRKAATVKCYATRPPKLLQYKGNEQPFGNPILKYGELLVPVGTKSDYMKAPGWCEFNYIYDDLLSEDDNDKDSTANILMTTSEDLSINLSYPKGYEASISIDENNKWCIYKVLFNDIEVTESLMNNTFTTPALEGQNYLQIIMALQTSAYEKQTPKISVTRQGENILIKNGQPFDNISVFNVKGEMLYQGTNNVIYLPDTDVYIIRVGQLTLKLRI